MEQIPGTFETTIFWPFDKLEAATGSNYSNLYLQTVRMRAYLIRLSSSITPLVDSRHNREKKLTARGGKRRFKEAQSGKGWMARSLTWIARMEVREGGGKGRLRGGREGRERREGEGGPLWERREGGRARNFMREDSQSE
jgi:hypothetical protein